MARDDRTRVEDAPRSATGREWEVFVREAAGDPLKHVGSVTAANAETAHEHASQLFDWAARDVWLCPADETRRYTTHSLGEDHEDGSKTTSRDAEPADSEVTSQDVVSTDSGGESA
jgi:rSAM-partnered protein